MSQQEKWWPAIKISRVFLAEIKMSGDVADSTDAHSTFSQVESGKVFSPGGEWLGDTLQQCGVSFCSAFQIPGSQSLRDLSGDPRAWLWGLGVIDIDLDRIGQEGARALGIKDEKLSGRVTLAVLDIKPRALHMLGKQHSTTVSCDVCVCTCMYVRVCKRAYMHKHIKPRGLLW